MHRSLPHLVIAALAALAIGTPGLADAATSTKAQQNRIKKFTTLLKKLPNRASSAARVQSLVKKLALLDPRKSSQYYALGLRKLGLTGRAAEMVALRLRKQLQAVVTRSGLSPAVIRRTILILQKVERNFTPRPPVSPTALAEPHRSHPAGAV